LKGRKITAFVCAGYHASQTSGTGSDRLFQQVESARDRLQLLSHRLVQVQELERRRIARELHDEVGQELTALRLSIEQCAAATASGVSSGWRDAQARVNKLLNVVRELSLDLRPSMLDDLGLLPALILAFRSLFGDVGNQSRLQTLGPGRSTVSPEIETAAYRIIQKHSPMCCDIPLQRGDGHTLVVGPECPAGHANRGLRSWV